MSTGTKTLKIKCHKKNILKMYGTKRKCHKTEMSQERKCNRNVTKIKISQKNLSV